MNKLFFYTNVTRRGNNLLVRGYDGDIPFKKKIKYSPTMYIHSDTDTEWKTLNGKNVKEKRFSTMSECRNYINEYKVKLKFILVILKLQQKMVFLILNQRMKKFFLLVYKIIKQKE